MNSVSAAVSGAELIGQRVLEIRVELAAKKVRELERELARQRARRDDAIRHLRAETPLSLGQISKLAGISDVAVLKIERKGRA